MFEINKSGIDTAVLTHSIMCSHCHSNKSDSINRLISTGIFYYLYKPLIQC